MKFKKILVLLLSLVTVLVLFPDSTAHADDLVQFGCEELKTAMVKIIGKEGITIDDMKSLSGRLDLSYLNIKCLDGLEHAQNVKDLVLSFNNITDISPIIGLSNLKSLYLDYNWLKTLPEKTNLSSLEHIDISNNEIATIPNSFFEMPSIRRIYMGDLNLEAAPNLFSTANTLDRLDISGAKIEGFEFVENLTNLELLMMNGCELESLPNLSGMQRLGYLYFADNKLVDLPEYLSNLPIIRLDLSGNLISNMPQSFANMKKLEQLVMTNNYFTKIPDAVLQMENLEVLMCGQNLLEDVPDGIGNLENIRRASFASNNLTSLSKFINFEIPYSYQISFSYNYLDLNDATNKDVLDGYKNTGGTQKGAKLEVISLMGDTNSVVIECGFNWAELENIGQNAQAYSLKLFELKQGQLFLLQDESLSEQANEALSVSYGGATEGVHDYVLCLEIKDGSLPQKIIKYSARVNGAVVNAAATFTPEPTDAIITQTPVQTVMPEVVEEGKILPKYLLYILLLGVIIIISAIILHFVLNRRK